MSKERVDASVSTTSQNQFETAWAGPTVRRGKRFSWRVLLWTLIYPVRSHQVRPTVSGIVLIVLSMAIGSAAYNSASNILFIALALMLACLILSGVLSWWNFKKVAWRIRLSRVLRVGHAHTVVLEFQNEKRVLPTYALWFTMRSANTDLAVRLEQVVRLDPGSLGRVEWWITPKKRGREVIELSGIGSHFPFGFLQKSFHTGTTCEALVWPAVIEYRKHLASQPMRVSVGNEQARRGQGADLVGVRKYQSGDSQRLVHWKASARLRQLVVRQTASEVSERYALIIDLSAAKWARSEQFEVLCSFAATLAGDFFKQGRLGWIACPSEPVREVHSLADLEWFLDWLALAQPLSSSTPILSSGVDFGRARLLTFAPEGALAVAAYLDGEKAAST